MSRHAARDRMNRETDVDAALREDVVQLAKLVLGLRYCHAVAGNDDHLARCVEDLGRVFRRGGADGPRCGLADALTWTVPKAPNKNIA